MWDLPGPGLEPVFPALAGGFLTTAPPGKPLTATSEEPGAKAGGQEQKQGTVHAPLYKIPPKAWAKHLSSSGPTPGHTPTLTPYKESAHPAPLGEQASKGTCYLFSLPPVAAGAPIKLCLNFLSGL